MREKLPLEHFRFSIKMPMPLFRQTWFQDIGILPLAAKERLPSCLTVGDIEAFDSGIEQNRC